MVIKINVKLKSELNTQNFSTQKIQTFEYLSN